MKIRMQVEKRLRMTIFLSPRDQVDDTPFQVFFGRVHIMKVGQNLSNGFIMSFQKIVLNEPVALEI